MKKGSILIMFLGALLMSIPLLAVSAVPTDRVVDANYNLNPNWYELLTPSKKFLTGTADTVTYAYMWQPKWPGSDIIFVRTRLRGTTTDSVGQKLLLDCYSPAQKFLYTMVIDTMDDSTCLPIKLPIGSTAIGSYYTFRGTTGAGKTASHAHTGGTDSVALYNYFYYPQSELRTSNGK